MKKQIASTALICALLLTAFLVPACAAEVGFSDVPEGSTFYDNVRQAVESGVMVGQTPERFGVRGQLTRLAALIIACRVNGIYETGKPPVLTDESGDYLAPCLAYAEQHGLTVPFTSVTGAVTRAEMAALLGSALPDAALEEINAVADDSLPDIRLSDEFGPAVYRLYRAGVLTGSDAAGSFRPDATISRGAAAAIATRLLRPELRKTLSFYESETHTEALAGGGRLTAFTASVGNGDTVTFGSLSGAKPGTAVAEFTVPGGMLYTTDGSGWHKTLLTAGTYDGASLFVLDASDGRSYMGYLPQSWTELGSGSRRFEPGQNGYLSVTEEAGGFTVAMIAMTTDSRAQAEFTLVSGRARLLDWARAGCDRLWNTYANSGSGRWCSDGYYWPSPSTYEPSGENIFYAMTDAYLCRSMLALTGYDRLAYDLGAAMMDVMAKRQNEQGYFPTLPESTWLSGDYGVGAGFYDTRFNTDLVQMFLDAYECYGLPRFRAALDRYIDFYTGYAASHHSVTSSGGWLVWDYDDASGGHRTHTSLNHQLSEALLLFHLADSLGRSDLTELGDRLLLAVTDTARSWVRADSNLHYGVYPNGSYGGQDYPYLTYNDLYDMQAYLQKARGARSGALDTLMAAKLRWMQKNGVTGYKK